MRLTIKQARNIKNIIAIYLLNVDIAQNGQTVDAITMDKEAWKHCDIPQRAALDEIIKHIRATAGEDIKPTLPQSVIKDLRAVIQYLYDDELKHFEESNKPARHIWRNVCAVENWLNERTK